MSIPDTIWAFPTPIDFYPGMTLRDYFAAKAMASMLGSAHWMGALGPAAVQSKVGGTEFTAVTAYCIADAMLAERVKVTP